MKTPLMRTLTMAVAAGLLGGCANFSEDRGFGLTQQTAKDRLGRDAVWIRSESDADSVRQKVAALLAQPLSADEAVQIALVYNPDLVAIVRSSRAAGWIVCYRTSGNFLVKPIDRFSSPICTGCSARACSCFTPSACR